MYVGVREVMRMLSVSRNKAYKIIQQLNEELKSQGYAIIAGKCSRKYFSEKYHGCDSQVQKPKSEP